MMTVENQSDYIASLEQALADERTARQDAEAEIAELYRFISDAGHDLKTPLTTLKTSLYLMQRSTALATPDRLETMSGQLERITHLIDRILLFSRLNRMESLAYDETDVRPIIEEAMRELNPQIQACNINIIIDAPTPLAPVDLNFEQFKRVLINMLDNAIRYSKPDANITIKVHHQHGFLVVDIEDFGTGMTADEVNQIFDYFYRGADAGNIDDKGAGLGLPIAQRIIDLHHGKIRVTSELNVGSTFRILLPIIDDFELKKAN